MIEIIQPSIQHASVLSEIGGKSFMESHGHSASEKDIQNYVSMHFNEQIFEKELSDPTNIYYLVLLNKVPVGYSKLRLNTSLPVINEKQVCKLDRLYVLKDVYDKGIGKKLFDVNVQVAKTHDQKGMWLFVWTENYRAIKFYEKHGFVNAGDTSFKISETHSNPNYYMYLAF
jgi:ribosomal protein S18 acetylase RimI-like enzyme